MNKLEKIILIILGIILKLTDLMYYILAIISFATFSILTIFLALEITPQRLMYTTISITVFFISLQQIYAKKWAYTVAAVYAQTR